jgi:hypothetical protein
MKVGDLCKVVKEDTHMSSQKDDLILVLAKIGSVYVKGINLKTLAFHHYIIQELEVISGVG